MTRDTWRETVLALSDPIAQRYTFARYALGESRLDSAAIAGALAGSGRMDTEEYDTVLAGWVDGAGSTAR